MATRTLVNDAIAASTGSNPSTVARQNRALADDGLVTKGQVGGAGKSAHYDDPSLTHLILAQAAALPSEAPAVVRVLAGLVSDTDERLADWLAAKIRQAATPEGAATLRAEIAKNQRDITEWDLTLVPSTPLAWTSTRSADGTSRVICQFHAKDRELFPTSPRNSVRHMTTIFPELILVAGELLADGLARRLPPLIPDPSPGRDGEGATPETTKASGTGIHGGLQSQQPAPEAQIAHTHKAQSAIGKGSKQRLPHPAAPRSQVR